MLPFYQPYHNINEINFAIKSNNASKQDLFGLYKTIVRLNALSPFYKIDDTQEEQAFLLSIKDRAMALSESIESLYNNNTLFHHKVIWDNPNILSAQLTRQDNIDLSQEVQILVEQLSSSQINESSEKEENILCPLKQPTTQSRIMINDYSKESLSNCITINDYLKVQLHNIAQEPVKISIVPDNEVIEDTVLQILHMYNDIISLAQTHRDNNRKCTKLLYDLSATFLGYEEEFLSCGISFVNHHLLINDSLFNEAAKDGGLIGLFIRENSYFKNLMNTLTTVYLNPFNYINRTIVTYPNTLKPSYINPYITSIYSGMFLNYFC